MTTPNLVANRPLSSARAIVISQTTQLWLAILTPAVLLVHGYHPFADDAAIYIAGIRKLVDPALYQPDASFVLTHTHFSVFAHILSAAVRMTHVPLDILLFALQLGSIFFYLLACWVLAERLFPLASQRWCSVALAAACFTLPVAGTSLSLMDPYVTARSFSTPLLLLALTAAIDRKWKRCLLLLLASAALHPLMTLYAAVFLALFVLVDFGLTRGAVVIAAYGLLLATIIFFVTRHNLVSPAYVEAIHSRRYLFPWRWTLMEDMGLLIPLLLFAVAARKARRNPLVRNLCRAVCVFGATAAMVAFLFVHSTGSLLLARLQPLRSFHIVYAMGVILIGGAIGSLFFGASHSFRARWMAVALLCVVAAIAYFQQRNDYMLSAHIEMPGASPRSPWEQAFLWVGANTPENAVFAANPDLIFVPGEDAQGFRAMSGRSLLADDKDEGIVAVFPRLNGEWAHQRDPQLGLDTMTDEQRREALRPLGADWLLLSRSAQTAFPCPYRNTVAQVCRLL